VSLYQNYHEMHHQYEIIQEAGDAIFVPSGWHHQVWNLVSILLLYLIQFMFIFQIIFIFQDFIQKRKRYFLALSGSILFKIDHC
jgi:hypothetical protein